jgi:glycosyltransferase involved in cell wall biosynthesis
MRLLFVSNVIPYPPRDGGRIRKLRLALALSEVHQVWMMGAAPNADELAEFRHAYPAIRFVELPSHSERGSVPVASAAAALAANEAFDAVHVAGTRQWPGEGAFRDAQVVLDTDNIESVVLRRMSALPETTISERDVAAIEALERVAFARSDALVVCSDADAAAARQLVPEVVPTIVPNGVDLDYFAFSPPGAPVGAVTMCFTGLLSWWPNADACRHCVRDILPRVRAEVGGARLQIVGRYPPAEVIALAGPNVDIAADVPDIRPYLDQADVFVAPLRAGGGTRLKILEALARGLPVVATPIGAEGLDVRDGEHLLIAEGPAEFAAAIGRIVGDRSGVQEMALRGRVLVEERYGWDAVGARLRDAYLALEAVA